MLTCRELTELVTDYLEGDLSLMQGLRFQFHVGLCRHCHAYFRQMKLVIRTLGALPDEPIPPDVSVDLLLRFKNWKR